MQESYPSSTRATIQDVAQKAGVSIATVSRVINGTGQVAGKTRDLVWQTVQELDYVPSPAARG